MSSVVLDRVSSEACACVCLQLFCAPCLVRRPCLVLSPSVGWPLSLPWPRWRTPSRMVFSLSWRRLRSLWSRFLLRGLPIALRTSAPARALALLYPRPLPAVPAGFILLSQRAPTGLSVKSCPVSSPDHSISSHRHSCSSASAAGPVESRSAAGVARCSAPSEPRAAAADPTASAARKASQSRAPSAAEARQRRRDKHLRRVRPHTKRSMWGEF